jgi:predicted GNAT family acetyltransferase
MAENVTDDPGKMRYEIHEDGEVAGYISPTAVRGKRSSSCIRRRIPGTGVRAWAAAWGRPASDDARKRGLGVLPYCPFVRDWIAGHPEYADLVAAAQRAGFGL